MATNGSKNDSQWIDVENQGITDEGEPNLPTERPYLAGPMVWHVCIRYIILSCENARANRCINVDLDGILEFLSTNNADSDDEMDTLQEFAKKYLLNLCICIINQNEKSFYYLNATSVEGSQQWPCAYLVFDKHNRCFYPFYTCDNNLKKQTTFPTNATYILDLFETSVENYKWPIQPEIIQQTLKQDVPTNDVNFNEIIDNQSENFIKASGVCNLIVKNVQKFMPLVGSELDNLNFSFVSSEYQLRDNDLVSTKTVCEALIRQLQMLLQVPDLAAENLNTNRITKNNNIHTSMETDETTIVQSVSLDNNEQDVLFRYPINTELSLNLDAQSTPLISNTSEAIILPKLELLNQPTRFRHNRESTTLGKGCPAIQVEGAPQRTPIQLKLPEEIRNYDQQFYIGVHAKKYNGNDHAQTRVAPKPETVEENQYSKSKKQEDPDEFDPTSYGVFSKINQTELKKEITLLMYKLKQGGNINKDLIKQDKLIWCRLMFAIYIKSSEGTFTRVSPPIYSDLIEETHRSQSIDFQTVFPDRFCERGGQIIFIPLDELVDKSNLCVRCNGEDLNENKFQIARKSLSFETPVCLPGRNSLHIAIRNKKTNHEITFTKPYHQHDNHSEPCGVINED